MSDGNEGKRSLSWMENLSLRTERNPRDLLQRFLAIDTQETAETSANKDQKEEEEIELSLGLSLGGRFGVDKARLTRSSSIAGSFPIVREDDDVAVPPPVSRPAALLRTSSLPVGTEEEWRKRKELQSLRRKAAKRRRSEKQRVLRSEREGGSSPVAGLPPLFGLPNWASSRQPIGAGKVSVGSGDGVVVQSRSVDFQGGSSSGVSESAHGSSSCGEASPASVHSRQEQCSHEGVAFPGTQGRENVGKSVAEERENLTERPERVEKCGKETGMSTMEDMPCVFTQGDGPNGRRIEGILYRYGKGEEVRIMCVCHGHFLSPAEFVEHAGGTDVAHPLKHIVVNRSSNSFL